MTSISFKIRYLSYATEAPESACTLRHPTVCSLIWQLLGAQNSISTGPFLLRGTGSHSVFTREHLPGSRRVLGCCGGSRTSPQNTHLGGWVRRALPDTHKLRRVQSPSCPDVTASEPTSPGVAGTLAFTAPLGQGCPATPSVP